MLSKIFRFIKFRVGSHSRYDIHSPFIYDFINNVIYDKFDYEAYHLYSSVKSTLESNNDKIEITDFGAASGQMKFIKRHNSISAIVKGSSSKEKWAFLIFRIVKYFQPSTVLELGTSMGLTTYLLSLANANAKITTVEGCPNIAAQAKKTLELSGVKNTQVVNSTIDSSLDNLLNKEHFQLIYFDGNHRKDATIEYFDKCVSNVNENSIFIIDDINWSKGMNEAWDYVKKHPKTIVSLDLFQFGIVFFKKELSPQHFKYCI